MADTPRIEELRRRVQKDRASIAFAQLAEEYRRAGRFLEAIDTCRTGLAHHPGYLSAHVTLGRALIETGELQLAQEELARVHSAAPENLAAIKGLAEIHHRQGERQEALALYTRAIQLAPQDPELEHAVGELQGLMAGDSPAPAEVPPVTEARAPVPDDDRVLAESFEAAPPLMVSAQTPEPASASNSPAPAPNTPQQIELLERWLDAILADRDRRE